MTNRHRKQAKPTVAECLSELWRRACEFDSIDPRARFTVFSTANKFASAYQQAIAQMMRAARPSSTGVRSISFGGHS